MSNWDVIKPGDELEDEQNVEELAGGETREQKVVKLVGKITKELSIAHTARYDAERAELTAALCLEAQIELAEFLAEAELISQERKSDVASISGERYLYYKSTSIDKKMSDIAANHMVDGDDNVKQAKTAYYKAEANYNKWKNLFMTFKDSHIYFRGIAKGKSDF